MPSYISATVNPVVSAAATVAAFNAQPWLYDRVLAKFTGAPQAGTYPVFGSEWGLGVADEGDSSTASPAERYQIDGLGALQDADFGVSTSTYQMREKGLQAFVSDRDADHYKTQLDIDLKQRTADHLMAVAFNSREQVLAAAAFGSSFTRGNTPSTKWGASGANSRGAVDTGKDSNRQTSGGNPDDQKMLLGAEVGNAMRKSSEVTSFIDTNNIQFDGSNASLERNLAVFWGVSEVLIGLGVKNSAKAGQTVSGADIWADFALLAVLKPGQRDTSCALFDFEREAPAIEMHEQPERRGTLIQCRYDNILVANGNYGYLFTAPAS